MGKKSNQNIIILLIIPAVILLLASMLMRDKEPEAFITNYQPFYNMETRHYSAHYMNIDTPYSFQAILYHFKTLTKLYLRDYLIPVMLMLFPSILLMAAGLSAIKPDSSGLIKKIRDSPTAGYVILGVLKTLLIVVIIFFFKAFFSVFPGRTPPILYLLMAEAFLILFAILVIIRILDLNVFAFLKNKKNCVIFLIFLFIFTFALILTVVYYVTGNFPQISDEFSYFFEASLIKSGKLYAKSPPMRDFFQSLTIINDGKWYSKVTIGWPMLLALGMAVGSTALVNPLLAAGSMVLLFLISKKFLGEEGAVIPVFIVLLSPFYFLMGGTYFSHTANTFFALLLLFSLLKIYDNESWIYSALSFIAVIMLTLTRPGDGLILFSGFLPLTAYYVYKSSNRKNVIIKLIPFLISIFAAFGILFWVNYVQNGNIFLFSFIKSNPVEKWGFRTMGHTPLKGLWNVYYPFIRIAYWTVPLTGIFVLFSFFGKDPRVPLLLIPSAGFALFYIGYFSMGGIEIGSRFYLTSFTLASIAASAGVLWLKDKLRVLLPQTENIFIPVYMAFCFLFLLAGVYKQALPYVKFQFASNGGLMKWIQNPGVPGPAIIFIKSNEQNEQNTVFIRNYWNYEDQKYIYVLYLDPPSVRELLKLFPERTPYTIYYDGKAEEYGIAKGVDTEETAYNYSMAAYNYRLFNKKKAIEMYKKALDLDPGKAAYIYEMARVYAVDEQRDKAIECYELLATIPSLHDESYYQIAKLLADMKKYREAVNVLNYLISNSQSSYNVNRCKIWAEYYTKEFLDKN